MPHRLNRFSIEKRLLTLEYLLTPEELDTLVKKGEIAKPKFRVCCQGAPIKFEIAGANNLVDSVSITILDGKGDPIWQSLCPVSGGELMRFPNARASQRFCEYHWPFLHMQKLTRKLGR